MSQLTQRQKSMILDGARTYGNFTQGLQPFEEYLTPFEAEFLRGFCVWIDQKIGGGGWSNIDLLFDAYSNPENKEMQKEAKSIKNKIESIKKLTVRKKITD